MAVGFAFGNCTDAPHDSSNCVQMTIGIGAQSTLGGHDIFARKIYIIKMPEFYITIARKIFSRIFGGTCPPCPRLLRIC